MTDTLPAPCFAEREFLVGSAMSKTITVLSHKLVTFGFVGASATWPIILLDIRNRNPAAVVWSVLALLPFFLQPTLLYAVFEDMRGRPVDLLGSSSHVRRRILPAIGTAFLMTLLGGLALLLLIVPGLILMAMWFVAIPACVVEQTGPWKSLSRSAALTKGNRWKVFGMMVLLIILSAIGGALVGAFAAAAGATLGGLLALIWIALVAPFSAILVVVTYHDLRVAKEGVDTDQIAAVFE